MSSRRQAAKIECFRTHTAQEMKQNAGIFTIYVKNNFTKYISVFGKENGIKAAGRRFFLPQGIICSQMGYGYGVGGGGVPPRLHFVGSDYDIL